MFEKVNSNKTLTIQISGGVGNQLFQYYAGFYAASKSQRKLLIDDFRVKESFFHKNRLKANMPIVGLRGLNDLDASFIMETPISKLLSRNKISKLIPFYRSKLLIVDYSPAGEIGVGVKAADLEFSQQDVAKIRIRGNLQSLDIVEAAVQLGALSTISVKNIGAHAEKLVNLALETKPIGIHLRLRDYGDDLEGLISGSNYYTEGVKHIKGIIPESPIWLFTDDVQLAMKLLPKSLSSEISLKINPESLNDLETMLVMSNCEGLVIANSTFSFWAGFFQKSQLVVAPKPWFKDSRIGQSVNFNFPLNWKIITW